VTTTTRPRKPKPQWLGGDIVTVGNRRWIIRTINRATREVVLEASNTLNHGMQWTTTLDKLPEKAGD
jgi:hypothetical protein